MILISKYLVPNGYNGLTIYPFVFLKHKRFAKDAIILNHEKIHLKQQLEMLILPFYIIYILEFLINLFRDRNWYVAYKNVSFEREAYRNEMNMDYLKQRRFWQFLMYYKNEI
ncbi:MAG: hypothetical protein KJN66_09635 [Bacteroidia bacterium]|nr:hypothetical protein [Bacteroidia bacterium]